MHPLRSLLTLGDIFKNLRLKNKEIKIDETYLNNLRFADDIKEI